MSRSGGYKNTKFIYIMKIEKRWCKLKEITLGSLFDGIGVFPLAARNVGIKTLWASEIDKNAIAISKRHFPAVDHLGDITKFQCLSLNGQMQEWCEGENLNFLGESWTPNISESLNSFKEEREYLLYAILEDFVPTKYYISPKTCSKILRLSETSKIRIPDPIEGILIKQGGKYQTSDPFKIEKCEEVQKEEIKLFLETASENQMNLFQPY